MKVEILGVKIDNLSFDEVIKRVGALIDDGKKHYMVTPNPEFLVAAHFDPEFKKILNQADLAVPDGVGLLWASRLLGRLITERVTGTDLVDDLCRLAAEKGYTVGFLGAGLGVAKKAAEVLKEKHPKLRVVLACEEWNDVALRSPANDFFGSHSLRENTQPGDLFLGRSQGERSKIGQAPRALITHTQIDLLFVAFGQVKQEKWIAANLGKIPVKVAMGVGGAFDFIAGKKKRAPMFVRKMALEWLFRLIQEPWRIKRQLALPYFVWLILKEKLMG